MPQSDVGENRNGNLECNKSALKKWQAKAKGTHAAIGQQRLRVTDDSFVLNIIRENNVTTFLTNNDKLNNTPQPSCQQIMKPDQQKGGRKEDQTNN